MISPYIKWTLDSLGSYKEDEIFLENDGPTISVNSLTGKAGSFYEKLRYLIDYKEEHTIRRSAIERIIKRKLLVEDGSNIGLSLLQELVGGGYLANKQVPEKKADDIQLIVDKYLALKSEQVKHSLLVSVMASEIEHFLYPQFIDNLVLEAFFNIVLKQVKYTGEVAEDKLQIQTYIACRRRFFEEDYDMLLYALLIKYMPELPNISKENAYEFSSRFVQAMQASQEELTHQLSWKISTKLKNYSIYFAIIKEIIRKYGMLSETVFSNQARLEEEVKKFLTIKYDQQREILHKSGNRAVMYILTTKIAFALALELPYEKFFLSSIDYLALGTNIVFHPLLLLTMVKTTTSPSEENTKLILSGVKNIIQGEEKPIYIKPPVDNVFLLLTFGLFYMILFGISFGFILLLLTLLNFNTVSILLFLFFITLVSYFGLRIRYSAKKWKISIEEENLISLLWNFTTIPIIRTGRWLSEKFSSINIFVFTMDFVIETPFKLILGTFDSFVSFLKETKEDLY